MGLLWFCWPFSFSPLKTHDSLCSNFNWGNTRYILTWQTKHKTMLFRPIYLSRDYFKFGNRCDVGHKVIRQLYYLVLIHWKLSQAPANVTFPWIAHAQSFKPVWNVRGVFIGWKVSMKKACVKIHVVWHAIKIYN